MCCVGAQKLGIRAVWRWIMSVAVCYTYVYHYISKHATYMLLLQEVVTSESNFDRMVQAMQQDTSFRAAYLTGGEVRSSEMRLCAVSGKAAVVENVLFEQRKVCQVSTHQTAQVQASSCEDLCPQPPARAYRHTLMHMCIDPRASDPLLSTR